MVTPPAPEAEPTPAPAPAPVLPARQPSFIESTFTEKAAFDQFVKQASSVPDVTDDGETPEEEEEARLWIEAVLGIQLEGTLQEALKSGVVLCNLANRVKPGCCAKPQNKKLPFVQRENIGNYLNACTQLKIPSFESFMTVDLFEGKNMRAVVLNLHSLGRVAQKRRSLLAGYDGPVLGPKMATANKREFTEAQLNAGKGMITSINQGAQQVAAAKGGNNWRLEAGRNNMGAVKGTEGMGKGGEMGLVGGSHAVKLDSDAFREGHHEINKNAKGTEGMGKGGEMGLVGGKHAVKLDSDVFSEGLNKIDKNAKGTEDMGKGGEMGLIGGSHAVHGLVATEMLGTKIEKTTERGTGEMGFIGGAHKIDAGHKEILSHKIDKTSAETADLGKGPDAGLIGKGTTGTAGAAAYSGKASNAIDRTVAETAGMGKDVLGGGMTDLVPKEPVYTDNSSLAPGTFRSANA